AFLAAVNAHDLDGAMALWAEDAVYLAEDGHTGGARRFGTGEVRARLEAAFKANQRLDATNFRVADDTVTYDWRATAEPARGLGAPPVDGTDTIRVRGGKIVHRLEQTDFASRLRQASALQAALGRRAAAAAQAVPAAQERGTPIARGTPTSGPWLAAAALALAGVVALAMFKRPHRQP
ncbi:MAG TPA: nuclear transport factor 2 family protein, partial [Candidatus Thermoplasmatota archaeon]|nr:nuclear transport factor 2 family protein [Candidatus Thermoplasmatota archaeon]